MTKEERRALIERLVAHMDDCAATGSVDDCEQLADALSFLSSAARHRGHAVADRLAGNIENAQSLEALSTLLTDKAEKALGLLG